MTVKGQVLTNNKDAGIPKRKDISIPQEIDVDIPISKILLQSPIKHIVLSRNQPLKKKVTVVTKEEIWYKKRKFDNWLGKFNNCKNNENNYLSVPCPAEGYNCGIFSNIFDNYGNDLKKSFLLNMTQTSWNWTDWNCISENSKNKNNH